MQITLGGKPAKKGRKHKLQARFERLQKRLAEERRTGARFERDIDELVERFQRQSRDLDAAQIDALRALAGRLVTFAGRKSLSDWHRDELAAWLDELVNRRIAPVDPDAAQALREDYHEAVAGVFGMSAAEMAEELNAFARADGADGSFFDDADGDAFDDGPDDDGQPDLFGFDDGDSGPDAFAGEPGAADDGDRVGPGQPPREPFDEGWAKALFRRAAQLLHPDREPEETERLRKQQRMRELLAARKQGDLMTLLAIFVEETGDGAIELADTEMRAICESLERQIETLEQAREDYVMTHPMRAMVYDVFYHPVKRKREQLFEAWRREMVGDAEQNRLLVSQLRNLERLKLVLIERRQTRYILEDNPFWEDDRIW
jgi:hypothetical protein